MGCASHGRGNELASSNATVFGQANMIVLKEIALNQLIRLAPIRELAKGRHVTGMNEDAAKINKCYSEYFKSGSPKDSDVLELGPGQTCGVMEKALKNGARSVTILDIEQYLSQDEMERRGIDYRIYDGLRMPFEDDSFDFICSHAVLEHVRFPKETIEEIARLLRPGGRFVHYVDLRDHFYFGEDNRDLFNCLQYKDSTWKSMTWNRSTYVNRLRYSEWHKLFADNGLVVTSEALTRSECVEQLHRQSQIPYLAHLDDVDAATATITLYGHAASSADTSMMKRRITSVSTKDMGTAKSNAA